MLVAAACGSCTPPQPAPKAPAVVAVSPAPDPASVPRFADVEQKVLDWLAADPRVSVRAHVTASDDVLKQIGMHAVMAEDPTAEIRGGALDLFAFRERAWAIEQASLLAGGFREPLPDVGPRDAPIERPKLERELLERLIGEERARVADESRLSTAAGDLVRGILSTWTPPETPQDLPERDRWVSRRLLAIGAAIRNDRTQPVPPDLDAALYPLERLLAPLQFPRGAAAVADVRLAADAAGAPPLVDPARVAASVKTYLGLDVDVATLGERLERIEQTLLPLARQALAGAPPETAPRAARLLFVEGACPEVPNAPVRSMAPPPERAAICGIVRALIEATDAAPLVALHDDVLLAFSSITTAPPPRTRLLSSPGNDDVDALRRSARDRPVVALGVALAAEILYAAGDPVERLRTWRALGNAPLDVVAREVGAR